jgi:hypothetical protein
VTLRVLEENSTLTLNRRKQSQFAKGATTRRE